MNDIEDQVKNNPQDFLAASGLEDSDAEDNAVISLSLSLSKFSLPRGPCHYIWRMSCWVAYHWSIAGIFSRQALHSLNNQNSISQSSFLCHLSFRFLHNPTRDFNFRVSLCLYPFLSHLLIPVLPYLFFGEACTFVKRQRTQTSIIGIRWRGTNECWWWSWRWKINVACKGQSETVVVLK